MKRIIERLGFGLAAPFVIAFVVAFNIGLIAATVWFCVWVARTVF